jgi:hypothetical protein
MTVRRIKQTLWCTAAALAGAAVLIVVAAASLPVSEADASAPAIAHAEKQSGPVASLPSLAELQRVAQLPLRRGLNDEPPATAQAVIISAASEPPAAMPLTLVGTIGTSLAMLRAADGSVELTGVGESAGGLKVEAIRPSKVQVQFNGRSIVLETPKPPPE